MNKQTMITVNLPREWRYRVGDAKTASTFGPGETDVPAQLAGNLIRSGHLRVEHFPNGAADYQTAAAAVGMKPAKTTGDENDHIPSNFPGRAELAAAGIDNMITVKNLIESGEIENITGIGTKTEAAIRAAVTKTADK